MPLDAQIDDWSAEHDRNVRTVIRVTAAQSKEKYLQNFPSDVIVVGDNWFYIAALHYVNLGPDAVRGDGTTLALSEAFTIIPKKASGTDQYVDLGQILRDFKDDLARDEFALFPVTDRRSNEATRLGGVGRTTEDWYEIGYNRQVIRVFPLNQTEKTQYLGTTPEGNNVGFTPITPDPKPSTKH